MEGYNIHTRSSSFLVFTLVIIISFSSASRILPTTMDPCAEFIRTRCNATDYPSLCFATLSSYAPIIRTSPIQMANVALNVTLSNAQSTATIMGRLSMTSGRMTRKEVLAVSDCVEGLTDSVEYLSQSLKEMGNLKGKDVRLRINDAQTWVSTALTDESSCMKEFAGDAKSKGITKSTVRAQVVKVAQLTSNALSLISVVAATE